MQAYLSCMRGTIGVHGLVEDAINVGGHFAVGGVGLGDELDACSGEGMGDRVAILRGDMHVIIGVAHLTINLVYPLGAFVLDAFIVVIDQNFIVRDLEGIGQIFRDCGGAMNGQSIR